MHYFFDSEVAKEIGLNGAIILENIAYWVKKNEANEANFYDGHYWTYNSLKAFRNLYPFWTEKVIKYTLAKLKQDGYIMVGQYSNDKMNHTNWYTLTDKGWSLFPKHQEQQFDDEYKMDPNDGPKLSHRRDKNGLSTIYTNIKRTDSKHQEVGGESSSTTEASPFLKWFADNINPSFGPCAAEMVFDLEKRYGSEACLKAGRIAIENNKRTLAYIKGILKRWETEGYSEHAPRPEPRRARRQTVQEMYDEGMEILRKGGLV